LKFNEVLAKLQGSIASFNAMQGGTGNYPHTKKRASGGIDIATQATNLTVGEAGPEAVITYPLTRGFSGNQYLNGSPVSGLSGGGGSMDILLQLSPDLEARVLRRSGDMIANVIMEVQRQR
jgi:hypothetical protein